jgi:hypothetical protein
VGSRSNSRGGRVTDGLSKNHRFIGAGFVHVHGRGERASVEASADLEKRFHFAGIGAEDSGDEHGAEVGRDGIEAAERDDAGAFGGSLFVIAVDEHAGPVGLAGDIDVVGSEADAGVDQACAVEGERAGGREQDSGAGDDGIDFGLIGGAGDQHGHLCVEGFELAFIASGDGPAEVERSVLAEIGYGLAAGEAGGAV